VRPTYLEQSCRLRRAQGSGTGAACRRPPSRAGGSFQAYEDPERGEPR
jgi:hypothetical protein